MSKIEALKAMSEELKTLAVKISILEKEEAPTTGDLAKIMEIKDRIREIRVGISHIRHQLGYRVA